MQEMARNGEGRRRERGRKRGKGMWIVTIGGDAERRIIVVELFSGVASGALFCSVVSTVNSKTVRRGTRKVTNCSVLARISR